MPRRRRVYALALLSWMCGLANAAAASAPASASVPASPPVPAAAQSPAAQPADPSAYRGASRAETATKLVDLLASNGTSAADILAAGSAAAADPEIARDPELHSLALSVRCRGYYRQSNLTAAQQSCAAARLGANTDLARFAANRQEATLVAERGRPAEAIPLFLESLAAAERSGNETAIAAALGSSGAVAQFAGANAEAIEYYDRALAVAARIRAAGLQATVGSNLGYLFVEAGKPDLARDTFERALQAATESHAAQVEFTIRNGLALVQITAGKPAEAVSSLRAQIESTDKRPDRYQLAEAQLFLARAELAAGNRVGAEKAARAAIDRLRQTSPLRTYPAYAVLIDALVANGKLDEADAVSHRLMGEVPDTARGRFELLGARARMLAAAQRHREAYAVQLEAERVREAQSLARAEDRLAFMRARNESARREAEVAELRQQQALVAARAQRDRLIRNFSLVLAVLAVSFAFVYWSTLRARRRLEAQIEKRQHIEALGKLTSGVAHDFNNLMTIVQQAMGLLRRRQALREAPDLLKLVDEAEGAARLGGQITQQLLAFARQKPMSPEIVRLADFVERQRPLFERSLGESMSLQILADPAAGAVRVDPGQLTTAVINLLVNARDAMSGTGIVELVVANVDHAAKDRRWPDLAPGRYVALAVTDHGHGMTPDIVRQAVTPFFTTKGDSGGSGLGLSSVDGFVSQSGGGLCVESQPGVGTTVTLRFPRVPTDAAA